MKCPFCGAELKRCSLLSSGLKNPVFMCENKQGSFLGIKYNYTVPNRYYVEMVEVI